MSTQKDTWETTVTNGDQAYYQQIYQYESENKSLDAMTSFLRKAKDVSPQQLNQILGAAFQVNTNNVADNKKSFYIALKLIACAQHGINPSSPILSTSTPLPTFKDYEIISAKDRQKYLRIFHASSPTDGLINGDQAMKILMRSKLPVSLLSHIWNLADMDRQGKLDSTGFVIAMHYVAKCMGGNTSLPHANAPDSILISARGESPSLVTMTPLKSSPSHRTTEKSGPASRPPPPPPPPAASAQPDDTSRSNPRTDIFASLPANHPWNVDKTEIDAYSEVFNTIDSGHKGYIEGSEAVGFFGHSNLAPSDLASVWDLADTQNRGQLSKEEFAIAMHLIRRVRGGSPLPTVLPASMLSHFESKNKEALSNQVQHLQETITKEQEDLPVLQQNAKEQESVVSDLQKQVDALEQSLQQVIKQKSDLQATLDTLKKTEHEKRHKIALLEKEYNTTQTELVSLKASHQQQLALAGVSTSQLASAQSLKEKSAQELALAQAGQFDSLPDTPLKSNDTPPPPPPPPSSRHHRTQSFQAQQSPVSTGSPNNRKPPAPPPSKKKRAGTPSITPIDNPLAPNDATEKDSTHESIATAVTAGITSVVASAALVDVIKNASPSVTETSAKVEPISLDDVKEEGKSVPETNTESFDQTKIKEDDLTPESHNSTANNEQVDGSINNLDRDLHQPTIVPAPTEDTTPIATDNEDIKDAALGIAQHDGSTDKITSSGDDHNSKGDGIIPVVPSTDVNNDTNSTKEPSTDDVDEDDDDTTDSEDSSSDGTTEEETAKEPPNYDSTALDNTTSTNENVSGETAKEISTNNTNVLEETSHETSTGSASPDHQDTVEESTTHDTSLEDADTLKDTTPVATDSVDGDKLQDELAKPTDNILDTTTATDGPLYADTGKENEQPNDESTRVNDVIAETANQPTTTDHLETASEVKPTEDEPPTGPIETGPIGTLVNEPLASGHDDQKQHRNIDNLGTTGSPEISTATTTATGSMKGDDHDFEVVDNASASSSFMSASMGADDDVLDEFDAAFSEALPDAKMVSSSTPAATATTTTTASGHFYDDVDDFEDAFDPKVFSPQTTEGTTDQPTRPEQQTKFSFDPFAANDDGNTSGDAFATSNKEATLTNFGDAFAPANFNQEAAPPTFGDAFVPVTSNEEAAPTNFADAFGDSFTASGSSSTPPVNDNTQKPTEPSASAPHDDFMDFKELVVSPEQVAAYESNPFDEPSFEHQPDIAEQQEPSQDLHERSVQRSADEIIQESARQPIKQPTQESMRQSTQESAQPPTPQYTIQQQDERGPESNSITPTPRNTHQEPAGTGTKVTSLAPPTVSPSVSTLSNAHSDRQSRQSPADVKTHKTDLSVEEAHTSSSSKGKHKGLFSLSSMLPKQKGKKSKSKSSKKDKSFSEEPTHPPPQPNTPTDPQYQDPSLETTLPAMSDQEVMANLREFGVDNESMKTLTNMGFTVDQAKEALERYDYDVQKATNFLLDQ